MRYLLTSLLCVLTLSLSAQIDVDQSFSIQQYAESFYQDGYVTNVTYTGSEEQIGYLLGAEGLFSVSSGLVLSTDHATHLSDPGCMDTQFCSGCQGLGNDQDLLDVANSVPPLIGQTFTVSSVNDLCILEFDFEAGGDSISFNYVFGSDEYLTYVNTTYNDIFAFFLSGPGITGPYNSPAGFPDGAINIASVPDSDPLLPVTISSVNNVTNAAYYIDNQANNDICINGYTATFTASASVQCGETYHLKLAIADGSDNALESFVVLYTCETDADNDGVCDGLEIPGCTDSTACNYVPNATYDDGSCDFVDSDNDGVCDGLEIPGCTTSVACNYDPEATIDDGSCEFICEGCTDEGACNYDPSANVDDSSCEYLSCTGCTDAVACNFNLESTIDDGSCLYPEQYYDCFGGCENDSDSDGICDELEIPGCTDEGSCNFNLEATDDDGSCEYITCAGCQYEFACNYDPDATIADNESCEYGTCPGCTDSSACNYNPTVSEDDGSCSYNIDAIGICGGSCTSDSNNDGICDIQLCPEDLNGDGVIGVQDLLLVLSEFGCNSSCENDINQDGYVAVQDILLLLSGFGNTCEISGFQNCGDLVSHDGYDYSTVQIGDQCWFSENCRYLPEVSPSSSGSETSPYYFVYGYEGSTVSEAKATSNYATYGVLYNWPAVMTEGICPSGWHIPSDEEFTELTDFLGGASVAGGKMKEAGYDHWSSPNEGATNSSGWTGLPGGFRVSGSFYGNGYSGGWWSASESGSYSWDRILYYSYDAVYRVNDGRDYGFSARCVRD